MQQGRQGNRRQGILPPSVAHHGVSHQPDRTAWGWPITTPSNLTFDSPVRLSEKYRPHRVADFVGLPKVKRVLGKFVTAPYPCSFLFYGPPGVGKTSMAQAMAEEMGAEFHHLGSQKCNVDNLEEVCRLCQYIPLAGG